MGLAETFLSLNPEGHIVGVEMNGLHAVYGVVDNKSDLYRFQGTKYIQSEPRDIYGKVYKFLKNKEAVFFAGLPCHVYALKSFLKNRKFEGLLMTCDLICNGVPSRDLLDIEISRLNGDVKKICGFRTKTQNGIELAIQYVDGEGNKHLIRKTDDFFLSALVPNLMMQETCYDCRYCSVNRVSDFTIGDFWGYKKNDTRKRDGVSLLICHNIQAVELLTQASCLAYEPAVWKDFLPHNPRYYSGKRFVGNILPDIIKRNIKRFSNGTQNRLLSGNMNIRTSGKWYYIPLKLRMRYLQRRELKYRRRMLKVILDNIGHK